jgi:histidinol-phosphatase (PHP family)
MVFGMPPRLPVADYHTHTPLCRHAEGEPEAYVEAAIALGLREIGFSDHSPMPEDDFDDWRMKIGEFPRYLEMVDTARSKYPEIPVKLGLEVDYVEGRQDWCAELAEMAGFDYLIGSVHYIAPGWDMDNPKWIGRWKDAASVEEIWEMYWKIYARCAASGLFDILAHPDLPKKFGFRPGGDLRRFYAPSIEAAANAGSCFEINTAGLRKDCREAYPTLEFLGLAREAGIPLVISSDAHAPDEVGHAFEAAISLAQEAGYTQTALFTLRERSLIDLPPFSVS